MPTIQDKLDRLDELDYIAMRYGLTSEQQAEFNAIQHELDLPDLSDKCAVGNFNRAMSAKYGAY